MSDVLEYKCPCCGGAIEFNSAVQKMKCPYCDTEFEMETVEKFNKNHTCTDADEINWDFANNEDNWQQGETDDMRVYVCNSCAGEIIGDKSLGATSCPYCGNPVIMKGQFAGDLKPDYVIPFKLDKEAAVEGFKKHLLGKKLLPKIFKDTAHIESVKGMYVPFWLFGADSRANVRYKATRTRVWSDSNYTYTKTSYYSVLREGSVGFDRIPVDGSEKMPDDLMESIEPFDFNEAVPFNTGYLSGYLADRYDVNADESIDRANERIKESTQEQFATTITGYDTVNAEQTVMHLENGHCNYALYPVWILNTKFNGEDYIFAMNGQTGKFVGNLPIDKKKRNLWHLGLFALGTLASYGLIWLFWFITNFL